MYSRILFSLKRKEILTYATKWMNLEDIMLGEMCQAEKDTHCMTPHLEDSNHRDRQVEW